MLPASSLSAAAYSLRELFLQNIDELGDINNVRIGHPGDNIKDLEDADVHCLNLFFYDVIYDGYPADGSSYNPFYVRLHCLITAVGQKSTEPESPGSTNDRDVSKGENELRLIGEVMRVLHEQPMLSVSGTEGEEIALLQVVPHSMNLDNLNHIWSTQNDISYRLSVAYEMALAPVPRVAPVEISPSVADPRMMAWGALSRDPGTERDGIINLQPQVEYLKVNTGVDSWMPHICFSQALADGSKQLHYLFKVEWDLSVARDILIAGKGGGKVKMFWNVWRKKTNNSVVVWKEDIADSQAPTDKIIDTPTGPTDKFAPGIVDPEDINTRSLFQVRLPNDIEAADTKIWQAALYAVHEWTHEDPVDPTRTITTPIKSNRVLFYGGTT